MTEGLLVTFKVLFFPLCITKAKLCNGKVIKKAKLKMDLTPPLTRSWIKESQITVRSKRRTDGPGLY